MFDDFDLFETCEEYYDDDIWEAQHDFSMLPYDGEISAEDQAELDALFG